MSSFHGKPLQLHEHKLSNKIFSLCFENLSVWLFVGTTRHIVQLFGYQKVVEGKRLDPSE